jgi:hypothetical protein
MICRVLSTAAEPENWIGFLYDPPAWLELTEAWITRRAALTLAAVFICRKPADHRYVDLGGLFNG